MTSFSISVEAHQSFAEMSGDWNPIHMDREIAERSTFGRQVLHGMNTALVALECFCKACPDFGSRYFAGGRISLQFPQPAYPGEELHLLELSRDERRLRLVVRAGIADVVKLTISPGTGQADMRPCTNGEPAVRVPEVREILDGEGLKFELPNAVSRAHLLATYPALIGCVGERAVAGMVLLSTAVGMEWPGLRSLFVEARIDIGTDPVQDRANLQAIVTAADPRHGITVTEIQAGAISAETTAMFRPVSVQQPTLSDLSNRVDPGAFANWTALVIGGSRGLGEIICKLAAAGGANIILTYRSGVLDAKRIQNEIIAGGGACEIVRYDAGTETLQLPSALRSDADLFVFYSASPHIFRRKSAVYSRTLLDEFTNVFVDGFVDAFNVAKNWSGGAVNVLYPSTEALNVPLAAIAEYAAAKAAGEAIVASLASSERRMIAECPRLPRLLTDQTNSIVHVETADPVDVVLPVMLRLMPPGPMKN